MLRNLSLKTKLGLLIGLLTTCAFAAGLLGQYGLTITTQGLGSTYEGRFAWAALALCIGLGTVLGLGIARLIGPRLEAAKPWAQIGQVDDHLARSNDGSPSAAELDIALRRARETTNAVTERLSNRAASPDVVWHPQRVTRERRESLHGHRGAVLWFTGLPSSGKSTIANALEETLHRLNCRSFVLDGDNVRHGLCGDLTFSEADREENIRRVAEVCRLFLDAGVIAIGAFVSPNRQDRERARSVFRHDDFIEIYCSCPVEVCEGRDPKGLYRRARLGEVAQFTGVSSPYEAPDNPELVLDTSAQSVQACVDQVCALLRQRGVLDDRTRAPLTSEPSSEPAS